MEKPVLILDYSVDRKSGDNIGRWFKEHLCVLRIEPESPFPTLDPSLYSAVVHSGSALSITDSHPFLKGAREFVRSSAGRVPQMGICYGHQLLAMALCGRDAVGKCPSAEVGWLPVNFLPSWPVPGPCGMLRVWQSHYDRAVKFPPGSVITASNSHTEIQAFVNMNLMLYGTQFHPEFDRESGNACFASDPEIFRKNGLSLEKTLEGGPDLNTGKVVFQHFLKTFEQEL